MQIFHFETTAEDQTQLIELGKTLSSLASSDSQFFPETLNNTTAAKASEAEIISVFVNSVVSKEVIDQLPALRLIIARSTGFDHIDSAYASSKGITVCNVPAYGSRTVAEFAFALILSLSRKLFVAAEQIKLSHSWNISKFEGFNLQGKTLGVIGTGRIGQNAIQIAKGFDMKVLANDAFPNPAKAAELGFQYVTLEELLANSDVVTLHVPATKETHHLINSGNINKFKRGALLINTSRGDVIDPGALLLGLKNGVIGGAGLDVLEGEHELKEEAELFATADIDPQKLKMLVEDQMLMDLPNVIVTPHIAFDTTEARHEIMATAIANIDAYLTGKPQNVIQS